MSRHRDKEYKEMAEDKGTYKSLETRFYEEQIGMSLSGDLNAFPGTNPQWEFSIFEHSAREHIYKGSLRDTIELILLGQTYKAQLQKESASHE